MTRKNAQELLLEVGEYRSMEVIDAIYDDIEMAREDNKSKAKSYECKMLVDSIYDEIGSCGKCRFASEHHVQESLIECGKGYYAQKKNWYCKDFEGKIK